MRHAGFGGGVLELTEDTFGDGLTVGWPDMGQDCGWVDGWAA